MLRLDRLPNRAIAATITWPVTLFRVRVRGQLSFQDDPLLLLILDLANAGERDPKRIAVLTGLAEELIRRLQALADNLGLLDPGGLTDAGRDARLEKPVQATELAWMLRDDLTGAALPVVFENRPLDGRRVEEDHTVDLAHRPQVRTGFELELLDAWQRWERALPAGTSASSGRQAESIELLDDGCWTHLRIQVWADLQDNVSLRFDSGMEISEALWREGLERHDPDVLRAVLQQGHREADMRLAEQADTALQQWFADRRKHLLDGDGGALESDLHEAARALVRAEVGQIPAATALTQLGILAESVLVGLCQPGARLRAAARRRARSLPTNPEAAHRTLRMRIEGLVAPDDDGRGFVIPSHLVHGNAFHTVLQSARQGRWPKARFGVVLQAMPLVTAALDDKAEASIQAVLARHPGLWDDLCKLIDVRNGAAHTRRGIDVSGIRDDQRLREAEAAARRALAAVGGH